jgi:hypothetical protein
MKSLDDVVGTWFKKGSKVLWAILQDGSNVTFAYSHVDVYGFKMVSYELFINQIPFQEHHVLNYHLFLLGQKTWTF